jgi:hypothetical protein
LNSDAGGKSCDEDQPKHDFDQPGSSLRKGGSNKKQGWQEEIF